MQDIDFDELDRAVSSVLGVSGRPTTSSAPTPTATPASAPSTDAVATPAFSSEPEASTPPQAFTPAFTPEAAPQSEAVTEPDLEITPIPFQVPSPAPAPASLPTVTRAPFNPASNVHAPAVASPRVSSIPQPDRTQPEPVQSPQPSEPQPAFTPIESESSVPVTPPQIKRSNGRFMDVVHPSSAMRGAQTPSVVAPQPAVAPVQSPPAAPTVEPVFELMSFEETGATETAPLETPFLPDAKVEKRPLGAFSNAEDESVEEPVAKAKPPMFEPALEISEEALIGASETDDTDPKSVQLMEMPVLKETSVVAQEVARPYTASITQQYTEQLSAEPQTSGAIFDTESYHQPLAHPQKKTSGILIVFWILGLIVLGVGIGVAGYYFFLVKGL